MIQRLDACRQPLLAAGRVLGHRSDGRTQQRTERVDGSERAHAYFGTGVLGRALFMMFVAPAEEPRHAVHGGG
jgi:hypothetical protein